MKLLDEDYNGIKDCTKDEYDGTGPWCTAAEGFECDDCSARLLEQEMYHAARYVRTTVMGICLGCERNTRLDRITQCCTRACEATVMADAGRAYLIEVGYSE